MSLIGSTNAERIWNYLKAKGLNDYACAGIIGNMDAESGLNPKNIQDSYEASLGFGDDEYVARVDSGVYTKSQFVNDGVGVFICQWTWHTRKQNLYEFIKARGKSVGDLESQLDFFYKELTEIFQPVLQALQRVSSVREASDIILLRFECPLNSGASVQALRASYSQKYYDRFAGKTVEVKYNMGYATVKKGSNTKMSEHFSSNEFDCHGSGCCTETIINEKLVEYLEKIREHFGKPIQITSGYRCVRHNSNIGGATGSRHSKGDAADIVITGVTPREVAKYAESIGIKGIGLYETSADGHFVHIDTRDAKSFWYGQACAARTTFGGTTGAATTVTTPESKNYLLMVGSTGNAVRALQENLVKLGYNLVTDGVFGNLTKNAVMDYQKKNGLVVDGIAGSLTQKSIEAAVVKVTASTGGSYTVKVNTAALNIRKGAGTNYPITGTIRDRGIYTIVAESTGTGASKWGKLSTDHGWISLDYCIKS